MSARALGGLGEAAGQLGRQVQQQVDYAAEQDAVLWATNEVAAARERWTRETVTRQEQAQPGAPDFTGALMRDFDADVGGRLKAAPSEAAARYLTSRMQDLRSSLFGGALNFEMGERRRNRVSSYEAQIEAGARTVGADPAQYDAVMRDLAASLQDMDLSAADRDALAGKAREDVAFAAAVTAGVANPGAVVGGGTAGLSLGRGAAIVPAAAAWQPQVTAAAAEYGVSPDLALRVLNAESRGRPEARSPVGAIGLMQLMPATAADLGVDPADPEQNIRGGVRYLADQMKAFGGNAVAALAAYNWGPANARRWLDKGADFNALPDETRKYITGILGGDAPPVAGAGPGGATASPALPGFDLLPWGKQQQVLAQVRAEQNRREQGLRERRALYAGEVNDLVGMMGKGYAPDPARLDALMGEARAAGDAATITKLAEAQALWGFQDEFRRLPAAGQQAWLNARRSALSEQGHATPLEAAQVELAEKVHAATVTGLREDPLSWAVTAGVTVLEPLDLQDPTSLQRRAAQGEAIAERYGTAPQVLTMPEARDFVARMVNVAPEQRPQAYRDTLSALHQGFGGQWPTVYRQLVKEGLPAEALALLMVEGNPTAGAIMASSIAFPDLEKSLSPDDRKSLRDGLPAALEPFLASFDPATQGEAMQAIGVGAERLAVGWRLKGRSAEDAITLAVKAMIGDRYGLVEQDDGATYRVPNTYDAGDVETVADDRLAGIEPEALSVPADRNEGLTEDQRRQAYADHLRAFGRWMTRADDSGLYLVDGTGRPALAADGGRIEIRFGDVTAQAPEASLREVQRRAARDRLELIDTRPPWSGAFPPPVDMGDAP